MTRPGYAISRPTAARRWLAVFALLSFFLQSLAVQTHIHPQLPLAVTQTVDAGISASAPAKAPIKNQDPMDQCRLCQELVHAGGFVTPSAVVATASLMFVAAIFAALPAFPDRTATAFAWQSRAPPRH
jgi:hypothetical protein